MSPFQNCSPRPRRAARSKMISVSGRASPGGGTTAGRSWISDCASALISKPIFSAFAFEGRGDRQYNVGQLGGRVHEEIGVGVEFQCLESLAPVPAVGMRQQHVGAEADHGAHRIGLPLKNGLVEIAGADITPARRPERALGEPLLPGPYVLAEGSSSPVIGAAGGAGNSTLPPRMSKEPGQRIEQRHRARSLRDVGVLLMPAPGVIGRPGAPARSAGRLLRPGLRGIQQIASTASGG